MGSLPSSPFPVLDDPQPDNTSLPAFMVSTTRGFLPRMHPIAVLPSDFDVLESLLQRMPIKTLSGQPGLLAHGTLGDAVVAELPDLTACVDKYKDNLPLMNALYRDYSFLASAYLLEPCHLRFVRGEEYGLARDVLPANVARPLSRCAELCTFKPFMEYAGSYALFNHAPSHPHLPLTHPSQSLRLIRAFEHGLDPSSSEAGFILTHVEMASHSGDLVRAVLALLSTPSRAEANTALEDVVGAMRKINDVMETMWRRSKPAEYTGFRTFIFGVKGQGMFPRGVVYEGVGEKGESVSYRGESGANDSIIPLLDNLVALPLPETPLTRILHDFRSYRPENHREFLNWVGERSLQVGLKGWVLGLGEDLHKDGEEVRRSRRLWLGVLDQIREFRWRHWCFAREYILKRTAHPTATGGSPIVTWLPNQLSAVLLEMEGVWEGVKLVEGGKGGRDTVTEEMMELVGRQREMLEKEVKKWCEERGCLEQNAE
ncbi:indoleamine 2,3-dioxygenase family protein [Schizothecium vesticola]|uniref:Indoleamine 2,3-dioxygenase family protein n=1 Tax=Schizothecium vesticola TaxID=314040 RepID=A0AA40KB13_9PEZI|nr:indoleamine 2,3-dioxygenase family protein [Schizothecium vesticola]